MAGFRFLDDDLFLSLWSGTKTKNDCCALELACNCALQGYFLGRKSLGQEALDVHTFHRHEEPQ